MIIKGDNMKNVLVIDKIETVGKGMVMCLCDFSTNLDESKFGKFNYSFKKGNKYFANYVKYYYMSGDVELIAIINLEVENVSTMFNSFVIEGWNSTYNNFHKHFIPIDEHRSNLISDIVE